MAGDWTYLFFLNPSAPSPLQQHGGAGFDGIWQVDVGEVFGVDGGGLFDFDVGVGGAVGVAGHADAAGFEPAGGTLCLNLFAGGGAVGFDFAFDVGVFNGGEFIGAIGFVNDGAVGHGQRVEHEGFEFDGVGVSGVDGGVGRGVIKRHFFLGAVEGQAESVGAGVEGLDKVGANAVQGNGTGAESQFAVGGGLLGDVVGQVAVFNDGHFSVDQTEVAEFFFGKSFGQHFAGHLSVFKIVQADEQRVDHANDGVVDLGVADLLDAAFLHVCDSALGEQGFEGSTVTIG